MVWLLKKKLFFFTNTKFSPPWVDKYVCPPVIWSHIFHRSRSRPIFRSISLVDTKKNPPRGILKFHIEADLKKMIYANIPGILL